MSRGIDIENISLVINYDVPRTMETYFHRIGRTGRNGRYGASIILFTEKDEDFILNNQQYFVNIQELPQEMGIINDFLIKNEQEGKVQPAGEIGMGPKKEYTYEPHSLISGWESVEHEFYDNTRWKYFDETEEVAQVEGGMEEEEVEGEEGVDYVDQNEVNRHLHDDDYWAFLKCPVCYQFLVQSEEKLGRKFQILQYFQVGNNENVDGNNGETGNEMNME